MASQPARSAASERLEDRVLLAAQLIKSDATSKMLSAGETIDIPVIYQTLDDQNNPAALQSNLISFNLHFDADALTYVESNSFFAEGIQVVPNATRAESDQTVTGDDNDPATETVLVASYSDSDFALALGWPNTPLAAGQQLYVARFTAKPGFTGTTINFSANNTGNVTGQSQQFDFQSTPVVLEVPPPPTPTMSIANAAPVEEGGNSNFTVSLSAAATAPVTVSYSTVNGTGPNGAIGGSDFTAQTNQTLTFNPGDTLKSISIATTDDAVVESQESFQVNLSNANGANITRALATGFINDNDVAVPTLSIANAPAVSEGNNAVFTVTLSAAAAGTVTVNYSTADGTGPNAALAGSDYTARSNQTLTFNPGETQKTISVATLTDAVAETAEEFSVTLSSPNGATISASQATGTINDVAVTPPTLSIADAPAVTEGTNAVFTVTLSKVAASAVSFRYSTADGTGARAAQGGLDYTARLNQSVTFNPGETQKTISIATIDDTVFEGAPENFRVNVSSATGATIARAAATGLINDNDSPPLPTLSISNAAAVVEGANSVFTVTLSADPPAPVTVNFATGSGGANPATPGSDFTSRNISLTFNPGGALVQPVTVATIDDAVVETAETFIATLSAATGATILTAQGTGTINDNDGVAEDGMIHGRKWNDLNGDGQRTSDEPWLNGWTIQLLDPAGNLVDEQVTADMDSNGDNVIDPETESGWYWFTTAPGSYIVQEVIQPGWRQTAPARPLDAIAYELDTEKQFRATRNNFENWGGRNERWFIGDGEQWYFVTPDGTVFEWDGSPRTNLTGTPLETFSPEYHANPALIYDAAPAQFPTITVSAGETLPDINFGNVNISQPGSIHGRKWNDLNGDGQRTSDEPWLNGWKIELVGPGGSVLETMTMDVDLNGDNQITPETESGWYWFNDVPAGDWAVREMPQPGWEQTSPVRADLVDAWELDQEYDFRFSRSLFPNWGGLNEHWVLGKDSWFFITPDGELFEWNNSPRNALSGTSVAMLTPAYHADPSLLYNARNPFEVRVVVSPGETVTGINFGNRERDEPVEMPVDFAGTGNVTVRISGDNLILTGDGQTNGVSVYTNAAGLVTVRGFGDTTIQGRHEPLVIDGWTAIPGDLRADMNGGNDALVLQDLSVGDDVQVNMGAGNDYVVSTNLNVQGNWDVTSPSGSNSIFVTDSQIGNLAEVTTGNGVDAVYVGNVSVGGRTNVNTGSGHDVGAFRDSSFAGRVDVTGAAGADWFAVVGTHTFGDGGVFSGGSGYNAVDASQATLVGEVPSIQKFQQNGFPDLDAFLDGIMQRLADVGLDGLL